MKTIPLPPSASALSGSLRDLGYSLESAVADIVDNSISAHAKNIDVWCTVEGPDPCVAIVDDGCGIDENELIESMRFGSKNPKDQRAKNDLGRFGLGLKTASFSQCKLLTVASRRNGNLSAAVWDLDVLGQGSEWIIGILDDREISELPWMEKLQNVGTLVLWRNLDRLTEGQDSGDRTEILNDKLMHLSRHLSLVFHRFISGELGLARKITIRVNGHTIKAFDPFCRDNKATQPLPMESLYVSSQEVTIQPYILPHHSKLSRTEFDFYKDRSEFLSNQGAYVYRNGRLMAWGDWFRLVPKGETTKLARVQIDFPSELDELWTIDIKKSRAYPPTAVRDHLRQIIGRVVEQSTGVHTGRAKKLFDRSQSVPMWNRYVDRASIKYFPNNDHPIIVSFNGSLADDLRRKFQDVLETVGASLPIEAIYADYSDAPKDTNVPIDPPDAAALRLKLRQLREIVDPARSMSVDEFRSIVYSTRLFANSDKLIGDAIEEEFRGGQAGGF